MIPGLIRPWFTNAVALPPIVVTDTLVDTDPFIFGPYTVDSVTGGTGIYPTYQTVITLAINGRTITLTGTDLNAAPDIVDDTLTLLNLGNFVGTMGNWTIDSAAFQIVGTITVITTATDSAGTMGSS